MTTPTTITYDAMQARSGDMRHSERMPRSTRMRSTGATRRAALAKRVRLSLRLAAG
jgi:hypothetical protein